MVTINLQEQRKTQIGHKKGNFLCLQQQATYMKSMRIRNKRNMLTQYIIMYTSQLTRSSQYTNLKVLKKLATYLMISLAFHTSPNCTDLLKFKSLTHSSKEQERSYMKSTTYIIMNFHREDSSYFKRMQKTPKILVLISCLTISNFVNSSSPIPPKPTPYAPFFRNILLSLIVIVNLFIRIISHVSR